jgi:hypothetical protein
MLTSDHKFKITEQRYLCPSNILALGNIDLLPLLSLSNPNLR